MKKIRVPLPKQSSKIQDTDKKKFAKKNRNKFKTSTGALARVGISGNV